MMITKKRIKRFVWGGFRFAVLSALAVIILYPVLYSLSVSIRPASELYDPLVILVPRTVTWTNIQNAMNYLDYPAALVNSTVLVLLSSLFSVGSCAAVGYGLARFRFKGRGVVFALVMLTIIVPPQTVIIPGYMNLRYFDPFGVVSLFNLVTGGSQKPNLIDTNAAFYLPAMLGMGIRSGLCIFIFRQFFRGMPKDLEDAAFIDGCSHFGAFLRIMAPNAGPAFLVTFLFSAVWYWNDYVYTTSYLANANTVMNRLYRLEGHIQHIMQYELGANIYEGILIMQAGILLAILPLLVVYIVLQKYFTESIQRSGIVG